MAYLKRLAYLLVNIQGNELVQFFFKLEFVQLSNQTYSSLTFFFPPSFIMLHTGLKCKSKLFRTRISHTFLSFCRRGTFFYSVGVLFRCNRRLISLCLWCSGRWNNFAFYRGDCKTWQDFIACRCRAAIRNEFIT